MSEPLRESREDFALASAWCANKIFDDITIGEEKSAELDSVDTAHLPAIAIIAIREKRAALLKQCEIDRKSFGHAVEEYGEIMASEY